jgi:hypothetical protein
MTATIPESIADLTQLSILLAPPLPISKRLIIKEFLLVARDTPAVNRQRSPVYEAGLVRR